MVVFRIVSWIRGLRTTDEAVGKFCTSPESELDHVVHEHSLKLGRSPQTILLGDKATISSSHS
jgi:hypothetical protein